jgi:hypothetical protein
MHSFAMNAEQHKKKFMVYHGAFVVRASVYDLLFGLGFVRGCRGWHKITCAARPINWILNAYVIDYLSCVSQDLALWM